MRVLSKKTSIEFFEMLILGTDFKVIHLSDIQLQEFLSSCSFHFFSLSPCCKKLFPGDFIVLLPVHHRMLLPSLSFYGPFLCSQKKCRLLSKLQVYYNLCIFFF